MVHFWILGIFFTSGAGVIFLRKTRSIASRCRPSWDGREAKGRRGAEAYGEAFGISETESVRSAQTEGVFKRIWPLNDNMIVLFPKAIQANKENGKRMLVGNGFGGAACEFMTHCLRMSDSNLVSICHACMCVWMQPYITPHGPRVDCVIFLTGDVR